MTRAFHLLGTDRPRPESAATIFCDGSADDAFRPGVDLELSHWIPNRTPARFRADTSTEICLNFATFGERDPYDLVVNNHIDVDGALSVFALVEPGLALQHRETLVGAAEMGDFWCYAGGDAFSLFVTLTEIIDGRKDEDDAETYELCFEAARSLLSGAGSPADVKKARRTLSDSLRLVDEGMIARTQHHERFAAYVIPKVLAVPDLEAALRVPAFNAPISNGALLLPQARNFRDKERVQLVSVETTRGWCHDLWYPGYMWADTESVWRAPGFQVAESSNSWFYEFAPLATAVDALRTRETGDGEWTVADRVQPFASLPGRSFPVVVSFLGRDAQPGRSSLSPEDVASTLAPVFA